MHIHQCIRLPNTTQSIYKKQQDDEALFRSTHSFCRGEEADVLQGTEICMYSTSARYLLLSKNTMNTFLPALQSLKEILRDPSAKQAATNKLSTAAMSMSLGEVTLDRDVSMYYETSLNAPLVMGAMGGMHMKKSNPNYRPLPYFVTIQNSTIEGLGLFATCPIPQHTFVGITHVQHKMFTDQYVRTPLGGFYNHSTTPNVVSISSNELPILQSGDIVDRDYYTKVVGDSPFKFLVTTRDIYPGEEITASYNLYDPSK
jgi:hypothetical protein